MNAMTDVKTVRRILAKAMFALVLLTAFVSLLYGWEPDSMTMSGILLFLVGAFVVPAYSAVNKAREAAMLSILFFSMLLGWPGLFEFAEDLIGLHASGFISYAVLSGTTVVLFCFFAVPVLFLHFLLNTASKHSKACKP